MRRVSGIVLGLFLCLAWSPALVARAEDSSPAMVGRITFIDGELLRYVYTEKDWVATVKDAPFGLEDAVYSSDTTKAEFKLPNGTWVRTGGDTQIQLIALREDVTEIDTASGTARLYNKSRNAVIKATTPFGYVLAQPGAAFDLYVGDSSAEVISLDGTVDFILGGGRAKYTVVAGGASIISDGARAIEGDGMVDADWDEWNLKREELWTQRVQVKGESVTYLPAALQDDAYDLDQNGRWERVYYEGEYRRMWRPTVVSEGWQPFTGGRWTVWYGDNVWIPEESFGYVTHHYGNWVYVDGGWFWAPPVTVRVGYLAGGVYWYPGRVVWIHSGVDVGWVPLAPREVYYSHRYWGPASFTVGARVGAVSIGIGGLAYLNHAVVVNQANFYNVNHYYDVRISNINRTTIINNYQASPVVNSRVIGNYDTLHNRFVYNTQLANLAAKPHQAVLGRINYNQAVAAREVGNISARRIRQSAAAIRPAVPLRGSLAQQVQKPRVSSRMVPSGQVNRPGSEVQFGQRQLKAQEKRPRVRPMAERPGTQPGVSRRGAPGAERSVPGVSGGVHPRGTSEPRGQTRQAQPREQRSLRHPPSSGSTRGSFQPKSRTQRPRQSERLQSQPRQSIRPPRMPGPGAPRMGPGDTHGPQPQHGQEHNRPF